MKTIHSGTRRAALILAAAFLLSALVFSGAPAYIPMTGDIVFQTSRSSQSALIQAATGSALTHCGLVIVEDGKAFVCEAVGPVRMTPLSEWIEDGEGGRYEAKRMKDASRALTPEAKKKLAAAARRFLGKPYDARFEWSDDRIYCSELVWKACDRGLSIKLCPLKKMRDFKLSDKAVRKELERRFGGRIPLDEPVVAPVDIDRSPLLVPVFDKTRGK